MACFFLATLNRYTTYWMELACVVNPWKKQALTPEFAAVANYGYDLDAAKFGLFLRRHCTEKLGVVHVPDHVVAVHAHDDGDIASVQTNQVVNDI